MKRTVFATAFIFFAALLFCVFSFASDKGLPSAEIKAYNLIARDDVYISYAVLFENAEECEKGLLIWTAPPSSYIYGSADYTLSPVSLNSGLAVFEFTDVTAKQMTDDFYAAAYVLKDGVYYYSAPKKYSILRYAYNKFGKTGAAAEDPALPAYLEAMLERGKDAQISAGYRADRLATDAFSLVSVKDGALPDGFSRGLFKVGDTIQVTYTGAQTSGRISWENSGGTPVFVKSANDADKGFTARVTEKNETYSANPSYKIVFIGDSRVARHSMPDILSQFARADGINIYGIPITNYLHVSNTFNIYALTSASDRSVITNGTLLNALNDDIPADFLFCFTARDFPLLYPSSANKERDTLATFKRELLAKNPNGKIILASSYGFQDGSPYFDSDFGDTDPNISLLSDRVAPGRLRSEHNAAIKARTAALNAYVDNFCLTPQVGDAFDRYYENYYGSCGIDLYDENGRDPSPAGSYYTAAVIYASVFGNTPCGSNVFGKLSERDARVLQNAAHEFVFGEKPPENAEEKSAVLCVMPDKTPSAYKTDEEYPENYRYLLETALAFRAHGNYMEYDRYEINPYVSESVLARKDYIEPPENATPQRTLYTDCATFIYSVYRLTFDYRFKKPDGKNSYTVSEMMKIDSCSVFDTADLYDHMTDDPPAELLEEIKSEFIETLKPGDVLLYMYFDKWGHSMLYLGNGKFIHSSGDNRFSGLGSDYNFTDRFDIPDIPGAVYYDDITNLIAPTQSRYIFTGDYRVKIIRPLMLDLTPTESALIRANELSGVSAYKLTSAPEGVTVSPGSTVDFKVVVKNYGESAKTLTLKENLPSGFAYTSGSGKITFTLSPGEAVTVAYTVKVPYAQAAGTVDIKTYLNGLPLTDTPIHVSKTLSDAQKRALVSAAENALDTAPDDVSFIKAAYLEALGQTLPFTGGEDLFDAYCSKFDSSHYKRNAYDAVITENGNSISVYNLAAEFQTGLWTSTLRAPNLFGGKAFKSTDTAPADRRVRNLNGYNFVAGDVLVAVEDIETSDIRLYLCLGENRFATVKDGAPYTINDSSAARQFLDRLWGCDVFFVVRPSKGF